MEKIGRYEYVGPRTGHQVYRDKEDDMVALVATDTVITNGKETPGLLIADKGRLMTEISALWAEKIDAWGMQNNLPITSFCYTNTKVAAHYSLEESPFQDDFAGKNVRDRTTIVFGLELLPVDIYVTGYLLGRFWHMYQSGTRTFGGLTLPDGMKCCDKLPRPLFYARRRNPGDGNTNEVLTVESMVQFFRSKGVISQLVKSGEQRFLMSRIKGMIANCVTVYEKAAAFANDCGLTLAEAKFDVGTGDVGDLYFGGPWLTPDLSTYWITCPVYASDEYRILGWVCPETSISKALDDYRTILNWLTGSDAASLRRPSGGAVDDGPVPAPYSSV